jgi:hypothetical protein
VGGVGGSVNGARVLAVLLVVGCAGARVVGTAPGGAPALSADAVRAHVEFLASDALLGRQTPSPGVDMAAGYVAQQLERAGLRGAGDGGGFVQRFPFPLVAADSERSQLALVTAGGRRVLAYGTDYAVMPGGPSGATRAAARFAGTLRGPLAAGTLDTARFDGIAVMRLPGYPSAVTRRVATLAREAAARNGALGVVFLVDTAVPTAVMRNAARTEQTPARLVGEAGAGIPAAFVRDAAATAVLTGGASIRVELAAPRRVVQPDWAPNVVALLPGRDPALAREYVVVSAHLDHVGDARGLADSVFNGADDNASGTAALVEIARALSALPAAERPRRSVLFVAVSGEEHGLLGSRWFVEHPTVPLADVVANVNLDMVGRNAPDVVTGVGLDLSTLGDAARAAAAGPYGLTLVPDPQPEERHFLRSDQYSFAAAGIPALMLSTGPHADYHRATDEASRLDADKAARVGRVALDLVRRVADGAERPRWTAAGHAMLRGERP